MQRVKQLTSHALVDAVARRIRNPLNALLLNVDNLEDDIAEGNIQKTRERLGKMRNTIAELDSLLGEVLRFSEVPKLRLTPIDMNTLIREVETFAKPESSRKGLTVRMNLQNVPLVEADAIQMKQAVFAVLLNAIENSSAGGSITVTTEARESNVLIQVEDEGEGIEPAHWHRIFEPFFSTKQGGIGLGLALALKIAAMHHGQLSFASEPGKGTRFIISLPVRQ
jgi:signal transduction histidine kinase